MKKIMIFLLIVNLFIMTALATDATESNNEKLEKFEITLSYHWKEEDVRDFQMKYIKDAISIATNGRVIINEFPYGTLHSLQDGLSAASSGLTDLTWIWYPILPGKFPQMELFSLAGLMPNQSLSDNVLSSIFDKYPVFSEMFENDNVVVWDTEVHMRADLHSIKPINGLGDLKGKIIACQNEQGARALSQLGASTTIMMGQDAYLAAQKGVVDGIFAAWGWVYSWSLKEVAPYSVPLRICPGTGGWIFNKDTWEKFTPNEQEILKRLSLGLVLTKTSSNIFATNIAKAQQPEENYIEWSSEDMEKVRKVFEPSWKEWVQKMEKMGYPGQDILEDTLHTIKNFENN